MTVEEFLAWGHTRATATSHDEPKWELFDGVPEMQEHEKWAHDRSKMATFMALHAAIAGKCPFEIGFDGLGVRVGPNETYRPDIVVFPAGLIADDDRHAPEPVLVVEVLSPSTRAKDLRTKLSGYGRVASIAHYIVVDPDAREVLHFRRAGEALAFPDGPSLGKIRLDPPGIEFDCGAIFGPGG